MLVICSQNQVFQPFMKCFTCDHANCPMRWLGKYSLLSPLYEREKLRARGVQITCLLHKLGSKQRSRDSHSHPAFSPPAPATCSVVKAVVLHSQAACDISLIVTRTQQE